MRIDGDVVNQPGRSYGVTAIRRSDGEVDFTGSFDLWVEANAEVMADVLASFGAEHIIVINTFDEPQTNRLSGGLPDQIKRCGGSAAVFESEDFAWRSAYLLVGICGQGEHTGVEYYRGEIDHDPKAHIDYTFEIVDGEILHYGPRP